ncbi:NAD(P)/FAD-dependent oxidoreductase [Paenibacillaceae bacterium WGS1546]|uniref:NAD(P)/FAD-dependent oxidoreductase n=1 Tax=Cohnella sp. WGS1546 TaxID=3366810 RepID=UPI00372D7912
MNERGMVIVGAGEAGARTAERLREQGWAGPITLIGKEKEAPYERPPLSKAVLLTDEEPSPAYVVREEKLRELNVEWLGGSAVAKIDRPSHELRLEDGRSVKYERLLLATGASPRRLTMEGSDLGGALYLRTFADSLAIRARLLPGKRVIIVGAGFIGLEVAASARERGCEVTVLEVGPRILMRVLPQEIASIVEERHRRAGVAFKLGTGIARVARAGGEHVITLADGEQLRGETLIIGIGAIPETALAADSGLAVDNGIATDERLATSDPDVFAAGDCCSFPHRLYGGRRMRLEAWRNAVDQGAHAAESMLGSSAAYEAVPWFWSDQYDLTLQVAGLAAGEATTVGRESARGQTLVFHLDGEGRLLAASGVGSPSIAKDIRVAEMLVTRQAVLDPAKLANPDVKLKALLAESAE